MLMNICHLSQNILKIQAISSCSYWNVQFYTFSLLFIQKVWQHWPSLTDFWPALPNHMVSIVSFATPVVNFLKTSYNSCISVSYIESIVLLICWKYECTGFLLMFAICAMYARWSGMVDCWLRGKPVSWTRECSTSVADGTSKEVRSSGGQLD